MAAKEAIKPGLFTIIYKPFTKEMVAKYLMKLN